MNIFETYFERKQKELSYLAQGLHANCEPLHKLQKLYHEFPDIVSWLKDTVKDNNENINSMKKDSFQS